MHNMDDYEVNDVVIAFIDAEDVADDDHEDEMFAALVRALAK